MGEFLLNDTMDDVILAWNFHLKFDFVEMI